MSRGPHWSLLSRTGGWLRSAPEFLREVGQTLAARASAVILTGITGIIVARALGPEGRGLLAVASAITGLIVQFGNFGLHASNTYHVSKDRSLLPKLTGNSLVVGTGVGGAVAGVGFVLYFLAPSVVPLPAGLFSLALISVPLALSYLLLHNLLVGIGDVRAFNVIEVAQQIGSLVLIAGLAGLGLATAGRVLAISIVVSGAAMVTAARRLGDKFEGRARVSWLALRRTFGYGIKAYLASLAAYAVLRADLLILGYLASFSDTGEYAVAAALVNLIQTLAAVVGTLLFPRLVAMPDVSARWRRTRRVATWVFAGSATGAMVAAALAPQLIQLLYGANFLDATTPFRILLPGTVLLSTNVIIMNYYASIGMPPIHLIVPTVAAAANILLNLLLVPRFGIEGAAVATSLAYGLMFTTSVGYFATRRAVRVGGSS